MLFHVEARTDSQDGLPECDSTAAASRLDDTMAYNLKRIVNLLGGSRLIETLAPS